MKDKKNGHAGTIILHYTPTTFVLSSPNWLTTRTAIRCPACEGMIGWLKNP